MRTIIAGSRGITSMTAVYAAMNNSGVTPTAILCGDARGVDTVGAKWAQMRGIPVEHYPADWSQGRGAGFARNVQMAHLCDALVAVWDGQSPGTRHMIETARSLGKHVHVEHVQPTSMTIPAPPPAVTDLPAGAQLRAGLAFSTVLPDCDFETYSEAGYVWDAEANRWTCEPNAPQGKKGLGVIGLQRYAEHPSTEVVSFKYDLKDGRGRRMWMPGMAVPVDLFEYVGRGGPLEAWNSGFEHRIWNLVCVRRYGWPPLPQTQLRCAMAKARAWAMPPSLEDAGRVLGIEHQKDKEGKRLLDKFSVPRNPTKADPRRRITVLEDWANDGHKLVAYNERDIVAEAEASALVPDMTELELQHWQNDQAINQRGMAVDMPSVEAAMVILHAALERYGQEMRALTGGIGPNEVQALRGWLSARSVYTDNLDAETVEALLEKLTPGTVEYRVVELRSLVGSASVKKVFAIKLRAGSDLRMRDMYIFYGARTGRPTGEGAQPTNMPKAGPDVYRCGWKSKKQLPEGGCGRHHGAHTMTCPWCGKLTVRGPKDAAEWTPGAMDDAFIVLAGASLDLLEFFFGDALLTIGGCLRGMFIAAAERKLVSSDFTAIEGVVIACLAGEQWRIDAYADPDPKAPSMYLRSASRMFGVTTDEMLAYAEANGHHHPLRQKGKGGELGLGFGGWIGALRGKNIAMPGTDAELKDMILKWRAASPAIVEFWGGQSRGAFSSRRPELYGLEGMAVRAIREPRTVCEVMRLDGTPAGVSYYFDGSTLYCNAPGGTITYHRARLEPSTREWAAAWEVSIVFEGYNTNAKKGPPGWQTMSIYGGLLAENVTQHVARNIQMHAINNCERVGWPVVMHTYDEIVVEVPPNTLTVAQLEAAMCDVPWWARSWPIKAAGGWLRDRYCKG